MSDEDDDLASCIAKAMKAMRTLDIALARRLMPYAVNDFEILMVLHKARYESTAMDEVDRPCSAEWLRSHGYKRMSGEPLLPKGELP